MISPQRGDTCGADTILFCEKHWKGKVLESDTLTKGSEEHLGHTTKHQSSFILRVGLWRGKALRQEGKGSFWCCSSSESFLAEPTSLT